MGEFDRKKDNGCSAITKINHVPNCDESRDHIDFALDRMEKNTNFSFLFPMTDSLKSMHPPLLNFSKRGFEIGGGGIAIVRNTYIVFPRQRKEHMNCGVDSNLTTIKVYHFNVIIYV